MSEVETIAQGHLDPTTTVDQLLAFLVGQLEKTNTGNSAIGASSTNYPSAGNRAMVLLLADAQAPVSAMIHSFETQLSDMLGYPVRVSVTEETVQ